MLDDILRPYTASQAVKNIPGLLAFRYALQTGERRFRLASRCTRLCLEGFPRSANSFASRWIQRIVGLPGQELAHHTHSVRNIRRAMGMTVPTIVLIREPLACCSSLVVTGSTRSLIDALHAYKSFYTEIASLRRDFVLLEMEQFIRDPQILSDIALKALNQAAREVDTPKIVQEMKTFMLTSNTNLVSLPHPEKEKLKEAVQEQMASRSATKLLAQCRDLRLGLLA